MRHRNTCLSILCLSLLFLVYLSYIKHSAPHNLVYLPNIHYNGKDEDLLDFRNFNYILKGKPCGSNISHIQIVTSYSGNVEARSAIRRAYPSSDLQRLGISRVFLLATLPPFHEVSQNALLDENKKFSDLVQGNFMESYRNLTYKHLMGLKWATKYCNNVKFVIKTDDDILVDLYTLVDITEKKKFQLMGYILKDMRPIRMKANKWYVTKNEYSAENYPPFLSGWMYIVTLDVVKILLTHARDFNYFWIDDLFVTGMVSQKSNITLSDISELFTLHPEVAECCMRKGLKCDFIVSPDGGDHSLQLKFQKHAKHCYVNHCPTLKPGTKVEDKCVAKRKLPPLRKGFPKITIVQ
ncbi:beta-1,3-galactosyltransferase 5 [Halyomorpha halys]|uniref:beta-1,3-galactosyltransferase 5 n=1 Tax=Halyomorpha halys TaxID=286706 RepID=UPI0006D4D01D|nr:beta-1,3-galactosyltransferase 5 [Halyomorpha halys]